MTEKISRRKKKEKEEKKKKKEKLTFWNNLKIKLYKGRKSRKFNMIRTDFIEEEKKRRKEEKKKESYDGLNHHFLHLRRHDCSQLEFKRKN